MHIKWDVPCGNEGCERKKLQHEVGLEGWVGSPLPMGSSQIPAYIFNSSSECGGPVSSISLEKTTQFY